MLYEVITLNWEVFQNEEKIADVDKSDFSFTVNNEKIKFDFAYMLAAPAEPILQIIHRQMALALEQCHRDIV